MTKNGKPRPERFVTCRGLALGAFTVQPDIKFNPDGIFKIKLVSDPTEPEGRDFKDKIDAATHAEFEKETATRGARGWEPWYPYRWETDLETGKRTGRVVYDFKRPATIKLRGSGEIHKLTVAVYDSRNHFVAHPPEIPDGSLIRLYAEFQPISSPAGRKSGIRMDFSRVKVLRLNMPPVVVPFPDEVIEDGWVCD